MHRFTIDKKAAYTVLSDFHCVIVGVTKMYFSKITSQIIRYRKYKGFHNETFLDPLRDDFNI